MRWSAVTTVEEAGLRGPGCSRPLRTSVAPRRPAFLPGRRGAATTTRRSRRPRSGSRCAGTPAGARSSSDRTSPEGGSSSAPARTCARSTSSSAPAGCCATAARASPDGCSPAAGDGEGGWQLPRRAAGRRRPRLRPRRGRAARGGHPRRRWRGWSRSVGVTGIACAHGTVAGCRRLTGRDGRDAKHPGGAGPTSGSPSASPTSGRACARTSAGRGAADPTGRRTSPGPGAVGLDLAAAWSWRLIVIGVAAYVSSAGSLFAELVLPVVVALLITALGAPGRRRWSARDPARPRRARRARGLGVVALLCLRRPAGRERRQRPRQPGLRRPRRDQGLAQDRAAARQRQPDQRLHPEGAGRPDRTRQQRQVVSQAPRSGRRSGTSWPAVHRAVLDVLLPRRRRAHLGLGRPDRPRAARARASTAPAASRGSR
jgi:hypothetical protein